jgi:hypothetical protein
MRIAHLGRPHSDPAAFAALRLEFVRRNPSYELDWARGMTHLAAGARARVLFVHGGSSTVVVGDVTSAVDIGDVIVQRPGEELAVLTEPIDVLAFSVPDVPEPGIPAFLRPDQDPEITDTPGGCATETGAYRRVVLTWSGKNGPYNFRALNTHRVRMTDSFSHYHPLENGFDELYLVQHVQQGAHLVTSDKVLHIERPESVSPEDVDGLLRVTPLEVGDLVYVGRGEMHRGVGGVLAHVITVPGFVPGCEIGVDHHLRSINERLGLRGARALPYNAEASEGPVVK